MSALKTLRDGAVGLAITFGSVGGANAQDAPRISEVINGRAADINCETGFRNGEPVGRLIAWVDTNNYHLGQTGPIAYALMDSRQRQQYWQTDGADPRNRPLYDHTARQYDRAVQDPSLDPINTLKTLLANSHRDFPTSRWDELASRCDSLR